MTGDTKCTQGWRPVPNTPFMGEWRNGSRNGLAQYQCLSSRGSTYIEHQKSVGREAVPVRVRSPLPCILRSSAIGQSGAL